MNCELFIYLFKRLTSTPNLRGIGLSSTFGHAEDEGPLASTQRLQATFYVAQILLLQHNQHFYLDVSVSIRDLHQKKFVQFLFRFLPR